VFVVEGGLVEFICGGFVSEVFGWFCCVCVLGYLFFDIEVFVLLVNWDVR